jgi:hypothetical protein
MHSRCNCIAVTTNKVCKHKFSYVLAGKKYCALHAKITFGNKTDQIQWAWRSYRIRNKMKNIFMRLNDDLQRKIIWHMHESSYLEKHHYSIIRNILKKRVIKLFNKDKIPYQPHSYMPTINQSTSIKYYQEVINIYDLYSKYYLIVDDECNQILYNIKSCILYACKDSYTYDNLRDETGVFNAEKSQFIFNQLWDKIYSWAIIYLDNKS